MLLPIVFCDVPFFSGIRPPFLESVHPDDVVDRPGLEYQVRNCRIPLGPAIMTWPTDDLPPRQDDRPRLHFRLIRHRSPSFLADRQPHRRSLPGKLDLLVELRLVFIRARILIAPTP